MAKENLKMDGVELGAAEGRVEIVCDDGRLGERLANRSTLSFPLPLFPSLLSSLSLSSSSSSSTPLPPPFLLPPSHPPSHLPLSDRPLILNPFHTPLTFPAF
jgi:hypothetical protein